MVALLVIATILLFLTIDFLVQRATLRRALAASKARAHEAAAARPRPEVRPEALPGDVFVDNTHTWVRVEASGFVSVGASPVALLALGVPDALELHAPGSRVKAGNPLVTLESRGRSLTLRAPLDGTIEEVNEEVAAEPNATTGARWLYRLRPRHLSEALRGMAVGDEARAFTDRELRRLRDAVVGLVPSTSEVGATMLDGGAPDVALADCLDEPAWDSLCAELFGQAPYTVHGTPTARERRLS